jgi:hypothetical protein
MSINLYMHAMMICMAMIEHLYMYLSEHTLGSRVHKKVFRCIWNYLLLMGCSVISVSSIICMLTLVLMPLAGLHFYVGLDLVTPFL